MVSPCDWESIIQNAVNFDSTWILWRLHNVSLFHGVTLGGTGKEIGNRHPKIGNNVVIGSNATILGNINVSSGAMIGASSVVLKNVQKNCRVAGNPARYLMDSSVMPPNADISSD